MSEHPHIPQAIGLDTAQQHRISEFLHEHPRQIGAYHILAPVGEGGMGIVYKAEQREPVRRIVALKLIKLGMDTKDVIARFESERQALAMMNHPGVARVFDAGATETGRPYFVMEFVAGESITTYCDRHQLLIRQRLELFIRACDGVQHAHQKAIIHRDLKPSNILVVNNELDAGAVKVIDFGVAKATGQKLTERTLYTERGQLIGTPEYMSPEQAEMSGADVDTRTDIYSLGVVLYELLTGALPFETSMLRSGGHNELQRIIRETDPPRPSTRLSSLGAAAANVARNRRQALPLLERELRSELEWIPLKSIRKDRSARYSTVAELAQDVRNYLANRPLIAGPESTVYRLRKLLRRNKLAVGATAAIALTLVIGIATTTWQAVRATRAQREAENKRAESEAVVRFLENTMLSGATPQRLPDKALRDAIVRVMLDPASSAVGKSFVDRPLVQSAVRHALIQCYRSLGKSDAALPRAHAALETRQRLLGSRHADTLESMNGLASVLIDLARFSEAETLLREATDTARQVLGVDHQHTQDYINNLAAVVRMLGRLSEAEVLFREALQHRQRVFGPNHEETLEQMMGMAGLLRDQGKYTEAELLNREALAGLRRHLGNDHTLTLKCLHNLGSVLKAQGAATEAEALMREASDGVRRVLGEDHPDAIHAVHSLATMIRERGDLAEAGRLQREVLEKYRKLYGDAHPHTLMAMNSLALVLQDQSDLEASQLLLADALAIRRRLQGDEHPETLVAINNLASSLSRQSKFQEAEPLFAEAYRRAATAQIPPKNAALIMSRYGPCLVKLKRYREAEQPLREARRRLIETDQSQQRLALDVMSALAEVCEQTNRPEEAASLRTAHADLAGVYAIDNGDTPTSLKPELKDHINAKRSRADPDGLGDAF